MFIVENQQVSPSNEQIDPRIAKAISSIFENRLPIFLPMKKLHQSRIEKIFKQNDNAVFFNTSFGKIEARARLITQAHKTYMEAMLSYQKQMLTDGSFYVEFKIHDLLSKKLKKANPTDYDTFKKYLKELKDFNVVIHTKSNKEIGFSFIDDWTVDNETGMYQVKFTRLFSAIWLNETHIGYKKDSTILNQIDDYIVQSVIRYMITYDELQISIKNLAKKLNYDTIYSRSELYQKLSDIRESFKKEEHKKTYKKYGIKYDKEFDNITICRTDETFINHCKTETLSQKLIKD